MTKNDRKKKLQCHCIIEILRTELFDSGHICSVSAQLDPSQAAALVFHRVSDHNHLYYFIEKYVVCCQLHSRYLFPIIKKKN